MKVSYIIPHKGRDQLLAWHLKELGKQIYSNFEVIVVIDEKPDGREWWQHVELDLQDAIVGVDADVLMCGNGPASARNAGARHATGDILLFVGSDCIPHPALIFEHARAHVSGAEITQGYSPWHPEVISEFTDFLDASGLQANWHALKNEDGTWKRTSTGAYCLTTNYGIRKDLFNFVGGFREEFPGAAWEDIDLGYRLSKFRFPVTIIPEAVNYHHHRYSLRSFLSRCYMEGTHRFTICRLNPEMTASMMPLDLLSEAANSPLETIYEQVRWYDSVPHRNVQYEAFLSACRAASMRGVYESIINHPIKAARYYLGSRSVENAMQVVLGVSALTSGHLSYAQHCAEWFVTADPDNHSAHGFAGEVALYCGNTVGAISSFREAIARNPHDTNAKERLEELS